MELDNRIFYRAPRGRSSRSRQADIFSAVREAKATRLWAHTDAIPYFAFETLFFI